MAPRIKIRGILACDPSWRGLAFIVCVPSLGYNRSYLYDLKEFDKSKKYKHPVRTTNIIQKVYDDLFQKEPNMPLVDKIIMESQHKPNMQVLHWLLVGSILPRLGKVSTEYISPLSWKAHFGIQLTGTHGGNKAAAVGFVENSKNRLVAADTVSDHNTADACLLLNSYLETTKNTIYKDINDWSEMANLVQVSAAGEPGTKLVCPKCKNKTGVVRKCMDESKKNFGKHFLTCWHTFNKGTEGEKKCGNFKALSTYVPKIVNGYVDKTWRVCDGTEDDDEVVEVPPTTGQKRALPVAPAKVQPPTKKTIPAAPTPKPLPGPGMTNLDTNQISALLTAHMKGLSTALKLHIDTRINEVISEVARYEEARQQVGEMREILQRVVCATDAEEPQQMEENIELSQSPQPGNIIQEGELDALQHEINY